MAYHGPQMPASASQGPGGRVALITGVTGQDGSYLAELLLAKGYRVVGTTRNASGAAKSLPPGLMDRIELVSMRLEDLGDVRTVIAVQAPDELYNCAAFTSGSGMFDDPVGMGEVNGLAVTRILESIRLGSPNTRFCQASSREIFGEAAESPQTENTRTNPRSPYGAAKQYADSMIRIYRRRYDLFAGSAILFNHESPRRRIEFVSRKITRAAAAIKLGLPIQLELGNLEARRDWGYAGDYADAMWRMLQQPQADDYVLATGETHSVREFCECAFGLLDLDYRACVKESPDSYRADEPRPLVGDIAKARKELGWTPTVTFQELVKMMVDADMRQVAGEMKDRRHAGA